MIELRNDRLIFSFPALADDLRSRVRAWIEHRRTTASAAEQAKLRDVSERALARLVDEHATVSASISFQRTLRIPDDGTNYPLPPGLGRFPIRHVDDFAAVPDAWKQAGGVMLPMHRAEAMWLSFAAGYPMAVMVAAGKVCAVSGRPWSAQLSASPQNYMALPEQPWLDGFRVSDNVVRQFIAVPLGKGLTVEQQLTGEEAWGGAQLQVYPLRTELAWSREIEPALQRAWHRLLHPVVEERMQMRCCALAPAAGAGFGAGGKIVQKITRDRRGLQAWDSAHTSRCFVRLCLAEDWQKLTGTLPPHPPPTARDYAGAGMPWFDYDNGQAAVTGETTLSAVKSVNTLVTEMTGLPLGDNESVVPAHVRNLSPRNSELVREF